jgi:hypothetical protein
MIERPGKWMITILRIPGILTVGFILMVPLLGNTLASDEGDLRSPLQLVLWGIAALAFALPLLLPWRILTRAISWRALLGWLLIDAVVLTSREIYDLVWFFRHRPFDIWATYILPLTIFVITSTWLAIVAAVLARKRTQRELGPLTSAA